MLNTSVIIFKYVFFFIFSEKWNKKKRQPQNGLFVYFNHAVLSVMFYCTESVVEFSLCR